jgi:hypothetical protein
MKTSPPLKAALIERSLSCFIWGLLGLIPVLGMPMALRSMQQHWRTKPQTVEVWNPARRYRLWGIVCARVGFFLSLPILFWIAWVIYDAWLTN